jgi:hypothetical protein
MAIHKHHCLKNIAEMFYTSNVHPMLNTQKIHDQLKRLQNHKKTKLQKELNHITNQTSSITTNKQNCVNETLV